MNDSRNRDIGTLTALLKEFRNHRLPRLLALKEAVESGARLSDVDLAFLEKVILDATRTMPSTVGHPELHDFCAHVTHLYHLITEKALSNEEATGQL